MPAKLFRANLVLSLLAIDTCSVGSSSSTTSPPSQPPSTSPLCRPFPPLATRPTLTRTGLHIIKCTSALPPGASHPPTSPPVPHPSWVATLLSRPTTPAFVCSHPCTATLYCLDHIASRSLLRLCGPASRPWAPEAAANCSHVGRKPSSCYPRHELLRRKAYHAALGPAWPYQHCAQGPDARPSQLSPVCCCLRELALRFRLLLTMTSTPANALQEHVR